MGSPKIPASSKGTLQKNRVAHCPTREGEEKAELPRSYSSSSYSTTTTTSTPTPCSIRNVVFPEDSAERELFLPSSCPKGLPEGGSDSQLFSSLVVAADRTEIERWGARKPKNQLESQGEATTGRRLPLPKTLGVEPDLSRSET